MPTVRSASPLVGGSLVLVFALGGCGGDDSPDLEAAVATYADGVEASYVASLESATAMDAAIDAFVAVAELADASDRVVDGTVVAVETGRPVTDPVDPTVGVRTQLVSVDMIRTMKGDAVETVVIEQEATLLDGTPITVNGVAPLAVGDDGRFYLVDGAGEQFPYAALTTVEGFVPNG